MNQPGVLAVLLGLCLLSGHVLGYSHMDYRGNVLNQTASGGMPDQTKNQLPEAQYEHELLVHIAEAGWLLRSTAYVQHGRDAEKAEDYTINELYYEPALLGLDWTLGKKAMVWGVGYGFRPLDVIQQQDRLAAYPRTLEGRTLIAVSQYTDKHSLTCLWKRGDSLTGDTAGDEDPAWACNHVATLFNADWHNVVLLNSEQIFKAGSGFSMVRGAGMELHAAIAYQRRYTRLLPSTMDHDSTAVSTRFDHGLQWLVGFNYTWPGGYTLLGEFWVDRQAYSEKQWRTLIETTANPNPTINAVPKQDATLGSAASAANLLQKNTYIRISYDGTKLDPYVDFLWHPDDHGLMARLNISYELSRNITGFMQLSINGGKAGSVLANTPVERVILMGVRTNWVL